MPNPQFRPAGGDFAGNRLRPWPESPGLGFMQEWLSQRRALVEELALALRAGFQAVAAFHAADYLDCIERQQDLCQRIAALDQLLPPPPADRALREQAAAELQQMNRDLGELADVQAALIERGGHSVRCFQRVWALGAPGYEPPEK